MIPFNNTTLNCRKMLLYKFHLIINQRNLPLIATEPCLCDDVCVCLCDDVCVCLCDDVWVCLCDDVCVCLCDDVWVCLCDDVWVCLCDDCPSEIPHLLLCPTVFNSLHPNISIHILRTVLCTFTKVLTRRICLTIKHFFTWGSFLLFSWHQYVIQWWYCKEKLDTNHS